MASLFNATNINSKRYFFATQLDGEQQLTIDYPVVNGISTTMIGITGAQGNEVQINQMPTFSALEFVSGEQAVCAGGASTYFTPSTVNSNYVGSSLSIDRIPGTGTTVFEAYAGNGSTGGIEFLSRGVNSQLISTTGPGTNIYISSIGRPGATAVLGASGTFVTNNHIGSAFNSTDLPTGGGGRGTFAINDLSGVSPFPRWAIGTTSVPAGNNTGSDYTLFSYGDQGNFLNTPYKIRRSDAAMSITNLSSVNAVPYPQNLLSTVFQGSQGVLATSNVVNLLYSVASPSTSNMIPGQNYLVDIPAQIVTSAPGGSGCWLDLGVRLGSNGSFNYSSSLYIPPAGTPTTGVALGIVQIADMGTINKNIDIVGNLSGVASLSISTTQAGGGVPAYMKMMT